MKDFHDFTPAKQTQLFEPRARAALDHLPVVGLVEDFDASMRSYETLIQPHFPQFKAVSAHENITSKGRSVTENVQAFADRIGADAFTKLNDINAMDFALYDVVKGRIAEQSA